jgi:hypothetical protein
MDMRFGRIFRTRHQKQKEEKPENGQSDQGGESE